MSQPITTLLVDNEADFAELAATMLEREEASLQVETYTDPEDALRRVENGGVECVVSDYDMPDMNGLELLEAVRANDPALPFILFTGKGSEEIASEAIAAGVTQYLQKAPGVDRYTILANQITNAVAQYRARLDLQENERQYERTITALHETTRNLMRAETKEAIYRSAIETARDFLDVPIIAAYSFSPVDGTLNHVASTPASWEVLDVVDSFDRGEGLIWEAFTAGESRYYPDTRGEENVYNPDTLSRSEIIVPMGTHGVLLGGAEQVDGIDELTAELLKILAANTEAALDRAEREQLLREHDRTLTEQNEELTRLNHTNEIVRRINRAIVQASTRSDIESAVCSEVADTERYRFAWITRVDDGGSTPAAWSGIDETYIDRISETPDGTPEVGLIKDAIDGSRVVIEPNVLDAPAWEPRRNDALTYGFQTVISVPLVDNERTYGALVIHAAQTDAVADRERAVLAELGETIGYAIHAVERTREILTDTRIELELSISDDRLVLNRLTSRIDSALDLEGVLDRSDRGQLFIRCAASSINELESIVDGWESVDGISVVSRGENDVLLEIHLPQEPFVDVMRDFDCRLLGAHCVDGITRLSLEVPGRVDTRSLVKAFQEHYPETDLHARRERTDPIESRRLDGALDEELTDRQFEALRSAHFSGFFEWPRDTTAEDLADALDISAPTYHYHLRAAQRKLLSLVFN